MASREFFDPSALSGISASFDRLNGFDDAVAFTDNLALEEDLSSQPTGIKRLLRTTAISIRHPSAGSLRSPKSNLSQDPNCTIYHNEYTHSRAAGEVAQYCNASTPPISKIITVQSQQRAQRATLYRRPTITNEVESASPPQRQKMRMMTTRILRSRRRPII